MFKNFFKKYEKDSIWISVLMLILATFLIFAPATSSIIAIYMFGIFIIINGIVRIISYFKAEKEERLMNFEFAEGVLSVLFGILGLHSARYVVAFLPIILGVWIIVKSIIKMQMSLNIRSDMQNNWVLTLVFSIISLMLGIIIIINPMYGFFTISIIGIIVAIYEIINIIEAIYTLTKLK